MILDNFTCWKLGWEMYDTIRQSTVFVISYYLCIMYYVYTHDHTTTFIFIMHVFYCFIHASSAAAFDSYKVQDPRMIEYSNIHDRMIACINPISIKSNINQIQSMHQSNQISIKSNQPIKKPPTASEPPPQQSYPPPPIPTLKPPSKPWSPTHP